MHFEKSWLYAKVLGHIKGILMEKLGGMDIEILVPINSYLLKPNISTHELDGEALSKVFYNLYVYVLYMGKFDYQTISVLHLTIQL